MLSISILIGALIMTSFMVWRSTKIVLPPKARLIIEIWDFVESEDHPC